MGKVWIGCSGWNYAHWRGGVFYPQGLPQKEEFAYYASVFDTVEINNTYYGLPKINTWENWLERAPKDFIYSIKANRYPTVWPETVARARLLKNHLGPLLFQFSPGEKKNLRRLKLFPGVRQAFEFRNETWNSPDVYEFLAKHCCAYVIISHPQLPTVWESTADFIYLRFHGSRSLYSSEYTSGELEDYAGHIRKYLDKNMSVYAYFNNDAFGFAPKNALTLRQLLT